MKKRTYSSTFYLRSLQLIALFLSVYFTVFYYQKINIYILIACFYWYTHVGISTAMHRYFSHRSFKASDWGSYFLAFWSVLSMVGSPIFWASSIANIIKNLILNKIPMDTRLKVFSKYCLVFGIMMSLSLGMN